MDDPTFWQLIDESRSLCDGDDAVARAESQAEHLTALLKKRSAYEIEAFERRFTELMNASFTWDLWGAAFIINGGCDEEGFEFFRAWLIGQGREVFDRAMKDPQSLLELVKAEPEPSEVLFEAEPLIFAAGDAYIARTSEDIDVPMPMRAAEPKGRAWDEAELPSRFPALWAYFEA